MTHPDPKPIDTERPTDTTELKRLMATATPRPWTDQDGDMPASVVVRPSQARILGLRADDRRVLVAKPNDRALIVAAVNALPALLTELDALRAVEKAALTFGLARRKYLDGEGTWTDRDDAEAAFIALLINPDLARLRTERPI